MKSYFSRIFGRSPVFPLHDHMTRAFECAQLLVPYFEAANGGDWAEAARYQEQIDALEGEADDLKAELRRNLSTDLLLSMDRRDVLDLLRTQDRVANRAQDIAGLTLGREMAFPAPMQAEFMAYLHRCLDGARQALKTVDEIESVAEAGFRGAQAEVVHAMLHELDAIERDSDEMQVRLRRALRELESELPPVDVMFLYKVLEWVGDLADIAEQVGNRIQVILAD